MYPNAPVTAKTGCIGRLPPHFFQAKFETAGFPFYAPFAGLWHTAAWSGTVGTGENRRNNWNGPQGDQFNVRVYVEWDAVFNLFNLRLDWEWQSGFNFWRTTYGDDGYQGIDWQNLNPEEPLLNFLVFQGSGRLVTDERCTLRIGTYARIPADSCLP